MERWVRPRLEPKWLLSLPTSLPTSFPPSLPLPPFVLGFQPKRHLEQADQDLGSFPPSKLPLSA